MVSGGPRRGERGFPSSYDATFKRMAVCDDPFLGDGKYIGQEFPLDVKLTVHPNPNGKIVINYPGVGGDIDGYNGKYATLGDFMQQQIGTVLRTDNPYVAGFVYENFVQEHLRSIIKYSLENSQELAEKGAEEVELYLMGFSAGASGIAAVAHEFPQVKKILLMAPSGDAGEQAVTEGLGKYEGECYIVIGQNDEIVGVRSGDLFESLATSASIVKQAVILDCDHQFRGETNGRIMSAAPAWAFLDKNGPAPSPESGIFLYS